MSRKSRYQIIRESLGYTQAEMADRLGVHQATVSKWEGGAKPSKPILKLLDTLCPEAPK